MIDLILARRVLVKTGRELTQVLADEHLSTDAHVLIKKALDDVTLMFDILHLEEIEVMDISKKTHKLNKGGKENGNC